MSTLLKTGSSSVHIAEHLLNQYKNYISIHISTSGHTPDSNCVDLVCGLGSIVAATSICSYCS